MAGREAFRGRWRSRAALVSAIAAAALLAPAASSGAAMQFGSNLNGASPLVIACGGACTSWNSALPAGATAGTLTAPSNGVITSFSVFGASGAPGNTWAAVHLRVIRKDDGKWSGLAASAPDVTPSQTAGVQTFPARVPIADGDYIGLETTGRGGNSFRAGTFLAGATMESLIDDAFPSNGSGVDPDDSSPIGLALRATLEPDADCDGSGDETQDRSVGSSSGDCACPPQRATIVGTTEDDVLVGTRKRDVILGLSGDDRIKGAGGADVICGHDGADRILGGTGPDRLVGGPGSDRLHGGRHRDRCRGGRRTLCER